MRALRNHKELCLSERHHSNGCVGRRKRESQKERNDAKEERQEKKVLIRVELGGEEVARPMQMGRTDPFSVGLRDRHWMDNASNGLRIRNLGRSTSDQTTALTVARAANRRVGVFPIGKELRQIGLGGSNDRERSRGAGTRSNPACPRKTQ